MVRRSKLPKKNPFKILDSPKDKKDEVLEVKVRPESDLDYYFQEYDLRFIPPEAFRPITESDEPGYEHLEKGLYVSKQTLGLDGVTVDYIGDLMSSYTVNERDNLCKLDWFEAKEIADHLEGRLMTLAEYFCTMSWIRDVGGTQSLLQNMTQHANEWIDGIVKPYHVPIGKVSDKELLYVHTEVKEKEATGGECRYNLEYHSSGQFLEENLNRKMGFPELNTEKNMHYHQRSSIAEQQGIKITPWPGMYSWCVRILHQDAFEKGGQARICFTEDTINKYNVGDIDA